MYQHVFIFVALASVTADYCQNNFTIGELPGGIMREALAIFLTGTLKDFIGCQVKTAVSKEEVEFWLFTRNNPQDPILLKQDDHDKLDASKPTKYLIHGWLCSITNDRMPELKDAYLKRYDANVIAVDWSKVSIDLYSTAFCRLPNVAKIIAAFICSSAVDPSEIHVVAHSMGGQLSGLVGREVQKQCSKSIGRITALDPAGLLFQFQDLDDRLDASDADHVQVIHSDQGILGYFGPCGDVDFFPNCGSMQHGCFGMTNVPTSEDVIDMSVALVACNHLMSCDYMIESINAEKPFIATSCFTCPGMPVFPMCTPDLLFPAYTVMGEDCPKHPPARRFYLNTNDEPPFARG